MKTFLSFTAVVEALTGVGLIFFPGWLLSFLLQQKYDETGGIIVAMVAGAAIVSLAVGCWLFKQNEAAPIFSKLLLLYNASLVFIVVFVVAYLKFMSIPLLLIGGFHLFQALWGLNLLLKKKTL